MDLQRVRQQIGKSGKGETENKIMVFVYGGNRIKRFTLRKIVQITQRNNKAKKKTTTTNMAQIIWKDMVVNTKFITLTHLSFRH